MVANSHKTAIARKTLPVPTRWLLSRDMVHGHVLDYGCGKCANVNLDTIAFKQEVESVSNYDPYYLPEGLTESPSPDGKFDVIICNYVLCTLPKKMEHEILSAIRKLLRKTGVAYISVRNDMPKSGYGVSSTGTFQRKVELNLPLVRECSQYRIYRLTRDSKLV